MAKGRAGGGRGGRPRRDALTRRTAKAKGSPLAGKSAAGRPQRTPKPSPGPAPTPPASEPAGPFRLGAIPGATPGKWIDTWNERMPRTALELVPLAVSDQHHALIESEVDAALVRLPIDRDGLDVIPLYDEVPVVVCARDSHLTVAAELDAVDLEGEVLIVPRDDVLGIRIPGTVAPRFAPPPDTAEAIATVAAGVGIVVVPMSLARLHQRKDTEYRPLRGGPVSTVALAWVTDRTSAEVETFVGIVRGRTANSSR
ncbi:LysR substrate-binding domain-containing protein [Microbacterium sp. HD4P20]|uniref:LysR substrate-binding domain-containing protein n=1 Tax=Microbacterium sp. HD4P20 TaxID=2864874 RepID=UPI001C63ECED|nr:LysR substrate-binding domain-containing protein [Microbacterium sp. HD4P20]MCP2637973.1 LysR substrate-binding domain-containing protein [Microbacterium sp. HD4P20]